jgi:hypothetical protein
MVYVADATALIDVVEDMANALSVAVALIVTGTVYRRVDVNGAALLVV